MFTDSILTDLAEEIKYYFNPYAQQDNFRYENKNKIISKAFCQIIVALAHLQGVIYRLKKPEKDFKISDYAFDILNKKIMLKLGCIRLGHLAQLGKYSNIRNELLAIEKSKNWWKLSVITNQTPCKSFDMQALTVL